MGATDARLSESAVTSDSAGSDTRSAAGSAVEMYPRHGGPPWRSQGLANAESATVGPTRSAPTTTLVPAATSCSATSTANGPPMVRGSEPTASPEGFPSAWVSGSLPVQQRQLPLTEWPRAAVRAGIRAVELRHHVVHIERAGRRGGAPAGHHRPRWHGHGEGAGAPVHGAGHRHRAALIPRKLHRAGEGASDLREVPRRVAHHRGRHARAHHGARGVGRRA